MSKKPANVNMVNWRITATTIYCDAVDDEATMLVYKDGSAKCTGHRKYSQPERETAKIVKIKSKQLGRRLGCEGPECYRVIQYRDRLFAGGGE